MRAVPTLIAVLVLSGCGTGAGHGAGTRIVAAFYPLAWAAERIAGPGIEVVNLTQAGAEPHDLELSPRDIEGIADADLLVYVGGGFQPAVEDAAAERDGASLDVLGAERDPHVWLDPVRFAQIVTAIGSALGRQGAATELAGELEQLDDDLRVGLGKCRRRTIVTTHAAFGGLAARYGLTELSLAGRSPEAEPSPRELERLVTKVRDSGATTVFAEPLVSDRLAKTVAREAGVKVAVLDPIEGLTEDRLAAGEDYLSVMHDNLSVLRDALGCRQR